MCNYTFSHFACLHGTLTWAEDVELCQTARLISAYAGPGTGAFDGLECPAAVAVCDGINDLLCGDCSEVWDLEGEREAL